MARKKRAAPTQPAPSPAAPAKPRIFVNIASYRDPEWQWTVKDLFEKATDPDRIFVGTCWQFIADEDADCFTRSTRPEQCRSIDVDARESKGACWARHQVQKLWRGEEYSLQIDSHMRFVPGWDERMIAMLARCPSAKPVLSTYPPPYEPPDHFPADIVPTQYASGFSKEGILGLRSRGVSPKDAPAEPQPSAFCAAGFLFAEGGVIEEIPYDPYLYFQGEEITLAARLYTHGWDVFTPNEVLIYHDYTKRTNRPRHWEDHRQWNRLNALAFARIRHLLGVETAADPEALNELERYGLGLKRSFEDYQAFSGIDFRRRLINGKTTEEIEMEAKPDEWRRRNRDIFDNIIKTGLWAAAGTRCGNGSTLAATEKIRAALPPLFDFLRIESLTDCGCGDVHWMREISGGLKLYFGLEIVPDLMQQAVEQLGRRRGHFFANLDITLDDLPASDAILCRDLLTHYPHAMVKVALRRLKASGSRHLIATTHPNGENVPIEAGAWQPINLCAAPFLLPPPRHLIEEGVANSTKSLGVWLVQDIPDF